MEKGSLIEKELKTEFWGAVDISFPAKNRLALDRVKSIIDLSAHSAVKGLTKSHCSGLTNVILRWLRLA